METVIDQAGRIVLPKPIRDALGLLPGTRVDISPYGAGAQVVPAGRTARLVEEGGALVERAGRRADRPLPRGDLFRPHQAARRCAAGTSRRGAAAECPLRCAAAAERAADPETAGHAQPSGYRRWRRLCRARSTRRPGA